MSKLGILMKYNLLQFYNRFVSKFISKKKKGSLITAGIIAGLVCLLIYALVFVYVFLFGFLFVEGGKPEGLLLITATAVSMLSLISGLTQSNSYIFRMKDYDMLMAMPIKNRDIITSKLALIIGENLLIGILVGIPVMIVYAILTKVSAFFFLSGTLVILCLPLIPIAISGFVSYILGFIPINQKLKNVFSTILYLLFFIVLMSFYTSAEMNSPEVSEQVAVMYSSLENVYFLAPIAVPAFKGEIIPLLTFCGISLISISLFILLAALGFKKTISNNKSNVGIKKNKKVKEGHYNVASPLKALIKKELINYINTPSYILNTFAGPIMSIIFILGLSSSFTGADLTIEGFDLMKFVGIIIIGISIFCMTLTSTSACSLSLEGKNFWILKTSPVNCKDVFISKVFINLLITIPFIIVNGIIIIIMWDFPIYTYLGIFLIPMFFVTATSFMGLYINILLPRFDFENPVKVIKQSGSVSFTLLLSFIMLIIYFATSIIALLLIGDLLAIVLEIIISLLYLLLSILLLFTNGVKKYKKIEF